MGISTELSKFANVAISAATGSIFGVLAAIFWIAMQNETTLSPADNYGPDGTWYHMQFHDEQNHQGSNGTSLKLALGGVPQNTCHSLKSYRNVKDGKSVKLYDNENPDLLLIPGTKIHLYWGRNCSGWRPHGVITVPNGVTSVSVPDLNASSPHYVVYNNFSQDDGGDRELAGHVYAVRWSVPEWPAPDE